MNLVSLLMSLGTLDVATIQKLNEEISKETIIHLKYRAGRKPSEKAIQEAQESSDWSDIGKQHDEYTGNFESIRVTKKGDVILTLFVHNRGEAGKFRAFNPSLGTILDVQVLV